MLDNVLQRYLAESFQIVLKRLPCRIHVEKSLWWIIFNEIVVINSRSTIFKVLDFQSRVPDSKPQDGSKVKSAFHPSEVD